MIGTTSRYHSGANRRFSRSSSWQKKHRFSSVEKSTNPKSTGFFNLYTNRPVSSTQEMCVSMTSNRSTGWS